MLQAQMIRTNGKYTYKYSNSKTDVFHQIIISQNYDANKSLLFSIGINAYMNYYKPLAVQYKLTNVVETIIQNLTLDEQGTLNCTKPPPVVVPVLPPETLPGKTFYVTSVTSGYLTYFVFKNYYPDDIIFPTYTYTFDMSDPSNVGNLLSFSFIQGGAATTYIDRTTTNMVKLTLPKDINYTNLYPYNENEPNLYLKYNKSGYTVGSFNIKLSTFAVPIQNSCSSTYQPINTPNVYRYNNNNYDILYLTASSVLYGYEYNGVNIALKDIKSNESITTFNKKFGLYTSNSNEPRTYLIYVPQMYTLAILNSGQETNISYEGDPNKVTRDVLVAGTEADDLYDFYYGTIRVTVTGSFQPVSLYTLDYGYLLAKEILVYAQSPDSYFDLNPYIFPF
jgi:hypothetical protein